MRPKILFVLHLPPPVHGAAMVGQFVRESKSINAVFDGRYVNLSTSRSMDDIGRGGLKKMIRYAGMVWKTLYNAFVFRPDLIYVTMAAKGGGFYKDAVIVLLLKTMRKKLVFHFHNKGIENHRQGKLYHFLYKRVFRNSRVILLSRNLRDDIGDYVDDRHVFYCPNGSSAISDGEQMTQSLLPVVLFIGNLAESKGIYDLLEALKKVKNRGIAFECNIVGGEGTLNKENLLQKISELGLEGSVKYRGRVVGKEKEQLLREADMLVHPSHEECFPLVLLEAMSAGLPVISTVEGGIPDIVVHNETGYLVEKKNIIQLEERITDLLQDKPLREKFGANGRKRFAEQFTLTQFEHRFTGILNEIASEIKRN